MSVSAAWDPDAPGWLRCQAGTRRTPSPNVDSRPAGTAVDLLVIHYISLPPGFFAGAAIEQLFLNTLDYTAHPYFAQLEPVRVSSHFLINRHGRICQFANIHARAWHAGESRFQGRVACNDFSVGIELQGDERRAFTASQYDSLSRLVALLRSALPLQFVAGHSDLAPGRKVDPGPQFDWSHFMVSDGALGLQRPQIAAVSADLRDDLGED